MRLSDYFRSVSLKTKTAFAVAVLFVLFVSAGSYLTFSYFERTFKKAISVQQTALVGVIANNIDEKLRLAQHALVSVAPAVPPDVWRDPEAAQRFLDARLGLKSIFDNNIVFMSPKGRLIAEIRYVAGRRNMDLSYRRWFKDTVADGKPHISDPFVSTHAPHHPAVMMTVPVFDKGGALLGIFAGSLDLLSENFLADFGRNKIGSGGYLYITDLNRVMIVHPDRHRIMNPAASPGVNVMYDRALKGFEGSGETVTSYGIPMISSYKRLKTTSWIVAANFPVAEAYAPLQRARNYFYIAALAATAALLLVTWIVMRKVMAPLGQVTEHVRHLPEKKGPERHLAIDRGDEIGILASAFNDMIETMDRQREELKESELQLKELNHSLEERIVAAVTDLRRKDQALVQQSRLAVMGEMINYIAHQWRQPLNSLGLIAQNIEDDAMRGTLDPAFLLEEMKGIMRIIDYMSRTIDDFRNFHREEKEKQSFPVKDAVTGALEIISASLKTNRIRTELSCDDKATVHGYRNEYAQVLLNILANARDILLERLVPDPLIRITVSTEGGRSVLTVADNARGIPDEALPRIFDLYFSTKESGKGTGIGLYMSKMIIEQNMGGRLTARNIPDGAEFRIEV